MRLADLMETAAVGGALDEAASELNGDLTLSSPSPNSRKRRLRQSVSMHFEADHCRRCVLIDI